MHCYSSYSTEKNYNMHQENISFFLGAFPSTGVRFVNHEYDYRQNWTTRSLLGKKKNKNHLGQTFPLGTMSEAKNLEIS